MLLVLCFYVFAAISRVDVVVVFERYFLARSVFAKNTSWLISRRLANCLVVAPMDSWGGGVKTSASIADYGRHAQPMPVVSSYTDPHQSKTPPDRFDVALGFRQSLFCSSIFSQPPLFQCFPLPSREPPRAASYVSAAVLDWNGGLCHFYLLLH